MPDERTTSHYRSGATLVLMAGIVAGIVGVAWFDASPWVSFAAGSVPVFLALAWSLASRGGLSPSVETFRAHVADEEPRRPAGAGPAGRAGVSPTGFVRGAAHEQERP